MRILLSILLLVILSAEASANTYMWTDEVGIHFTDNPGSIPLKYREQAMAEVRTDEGRVDQLVAESPPAVDMYEFGKTATSQKRGPKKAKQFRRGRLLSTTEAMEASNKQDGCYLNFASEPGENIAWTPNSSFSGMMKMEVQTESDCLQDCMDNAQQKALDVAKRWKLVGTCKYYGQQIWRR